MRGLCATHIKQFRSRGYTWPIGQPPGSSIYVEGSVARVELSNCPDLCLTDADAVELITGYRWFKGSGGYAQAHPRDGSQNKLWMHRIVLGIAGADSRTTQTDHISGQRLDNRRINLRAVTPAQNAQNAVRPGRESLRGVRFDKRNGRWGAAVRVNHVTISGGWFDSQGEAKKAARELRAQYLTHHNESRHTEPAGLC